MNLVKFLLIVSLLGCGRLVAAEPLRVMVLYTVAECTELTAREFQKVNNQEVQVVPLSTENYLSLLSSGHVGNYDVYEIWYVLLKDYVKNGVLIELTDKVGENDIEDFFPNILRHYGYVDNKLYALPYDGDCHFLYYRPAILKKYNLPPPKTWEEFFNSVKIISENESGNGVWGTALMANNNPFNVTTLFFNRLGWNGGSGEELRNRISRALKALKETLSYAHPDALKTNYKMSRALFLGGKIALLEQYNDLSLRADDKTQSVIKGDWDATIMPRWSDDTENVTSMNGGFGIAVNKNSKNLEPAVSFVKFAASAKMQKIRSMSNCGVEPTRISVLTDPEYYSYSINTALFAATYRKITPWVRDVKRVMKITTVLHRYLSGSTQVDEATGDLMILLGASQ